MTRKSSIVSITSASTQDTELPNTPPGKDPEAKRVELEVIPDSPLKQIGHCNASGPESKDTGGYSRIGLFTVNIVAGIIGSQLAFGMMPYDVYSVWYEVVRMLSLVCLAFIMVNVGYEFNLDKSNLRLYGTDTLVAMTAAGFPWLFVAGWFIWALPNPLPWEQALVAARFAAPTSAGVLFCMLEAAGLKETWLFKKARILAIFDDLDTILFMVPLKAILVGFKWELLVILGTVFGMLYFGYRYLHVYALPTGWRWTMLYAVVIATVTEVVYFTTHHHIVMEAIHIEVLLPAFILGVVIRIEDHANDHQHNIDFAEDKQTSAHMQDEKVLTCVSALFMVFVGLSMPPLFGGDSGEGDSEPISAGAFVGHCAAVTFLMVLGKMFPLACYSKEANLRTRFALAMGMCPRGEVGAGVILISLDLGIKGEAIGIAVVCLALNMVLTGGFIITVKRLVTAAVPVSSEILPSLIPVVPKKSAADEDLGVPVSTDSSSQGSSGSDDLPGVVHHVIPEMTEV
jgi:Kef-type K+ transport system membrane component KefB